MRLREDYLAKSQMNKMVHGESLITKAGQKINLTLPKWFVYGGGFDTLNLRRVFIDRWITDDFTMPVSSGNFLEYSLDCNRACLAMGMIVWELLTIGLKCYVFSSSQKHLEFAQRMNKARLIRAYDRVGLPKNKDEFKDFLGGGFEMNEGLVPDGKATERIFDLMETG